MSENRRTDEDMIEPSKYSVPEQEFQVQIKLKPEAGLRVDTAYRLSSTTNTNLSSLEDILTKHDVKLERAFAETEDALTARVAEAKAEGVELPDLSRSYIIRTKDKEAAEAVAKDLTDNDLVEVAEVTPPAYPADVGTATSSFFGMQGYLDPAPGGIDAKYAWTRPGGKGTGIKLIDIEGAWNFSHEDLQDHQSGLAGGTMTNSLSWRNHGTAAMGEIGGDENGFGVTGIAPESDQRGYSIFGTGNSTAEAIRGAADLLQKGDIIFIVIQRPGPDAPNPLFSQEGFIAIEWYPHEFDAIKYATSKGIIVVEAAGNGSRDLDAAVFQGRFNRSNRDSGAILVGAGAPPSGTYGPDRSRLSFSNWGAIIDAQGWGKEVVTTGGRRSQQGDLLGGDDENKWYTKSFGGTSSAAPIVAGAITCLQGIRKNKGELPFTFTEIRDELRTLGSPQQDHPDRPATQRIGNRPDLKKVINKFWPAAYTLKLNKVGLGTVKREPIRDTYSEGEIVKLTAKPANIYWRFKEWSDDLTGRTNPDNITMDGNKLVTAIFHKCPFSMVTAGSMLASTVNFLRMYREEIVMKSVFKTQFERLLNRYYQFTPYVVRKMNESSLYERFVKYVIAFPFVLGAKVVVLSTRALANGKSTHPSR